jgi:hypothetical protein
MADAKGFAKGQRKEPPRADGLAPPSSLDQAGIPASPKDGGTFAARPKDSGIVRASGKLAGTQDIPLAPPGR